MRNQPAKADDIEGTRLQLSGRGDHEKEPA